MARPIADLLGQEVTAVAFVRDGVVLHFGSGVLRGIAEPSVTIGEATYRFPKAGSRDALCLLIGSTVVAVDPGDGGEVAVTTSNGCCVRIPCRGGQPELS